MRQNKPSVSLSINFRRWLLLAFAASLCFAAVNFERARAQQPAASPQKSRTKRITPLRTSDTADGSRVTITSDGELNDYSAYRSGDRFIVVVPQAEGGGGGARGRGFEGAQVEKRGKDLVYTFKLQPGATARVNQRFNRLDVQFSAAKGANANPAVKPTPAPTPTNANAALASATPFAIPSPTPATTTEAAPTPTLAPATPGAEQIAQAHPSIAPPTSITTAAPSNTTPTSVGAVVTRNWPWLLIALLAVGIGLFFVSRLSGGDRDGSKSLPPAAPSGAKPATLKETKTPELKPSPVSTVATTTGATGAAATPAVAEGTTAAAATGATAAAAATGAAALETSGKQSKKKKKKAEKAKRLAAANDAKAGGSVAATGAIIAGAVLSDTTKVEDSREDETKAVEVKAAETKAVEPAVAFDPELIEAEIKKVLAGESYDESVVNAADEGTRQLVSAELMSAIAGRNAARQAHARTAFLKHGYFEAATRALQSAEAPGERAAAAHTLGLLGDPSATAHLTAALEDPSADVRRTSVEALAELRDPSAVGALEALRWREKSRQVPRTLIQRAIEACQPEAEEAAAHVVEDHAPTPAAATAASAATETQSVEATPLAAKETAAAQEPEIKEAETKELELAYATPVVAEVTPLASESASAGAAEADAPFEDLTVESPALTARETGTIEAPVAVEEAATAFAPDAADEETKAIEIRETEASALTAPHLESAPPAATAEVETGTIQASSAAPVETDLAATLAAKEATLIEARKRETESAASAETTTDIELLDATPHAASPVTSLDLFDDSAPATHAEPEPQPVYRSDFAAGSGRPAVGDDDWIDLDADDQEVTIQSIEPAEPVGVFYAEDAGGLSATPAPDASASAARHNETDALFDTLEVEAFETNAATPIRMSPIAESARVEQQPLPPTPAFETRPPVASSDPEPVRGAEIVKADKGLSLLDGSDEDNYSIIPKGIQLRLASDDANERAQSVLALARLNTDEAFDQICAAFDDPAEEVRNAAARAIYDMNGDRADSFTRALRESPVERRRQIGAALAGSGLADEAIGNLTGESRDKTYDAFSLLFLMAKAGEVAPLIRAIESHHDNEVRLAVVKLLALSGQHEILPSFRRLAVRGSLPTEVRSAVMEAIYQISSQPNAPTPAT
jgi:HEAT repeat protein